MKDFFISYVQFFNENWILLAILWVILIILARTKMEMYWLDIIIPLIGFLTWGIAALLL